MLGLPGFDFESSPDILARAGFDAAVGAGLIAQDKLGNQTSASIDLSPAAAEPVCAGIYQLDSIVRRAASLQLTVDARMGQKRASVSDAQEALA